MDTTVTAALTNRCAMPFARRVARDMRQGAALDDAMTYRSVPRALMDDVRLIMSAVQTGWFEVPTGPDLTFSKTQHGRLTVLSSRVPWLCELVTEAAAFETMRRVGGHYRARAFGAKTLPNFHTSATSAMTRLSRLPRDHVAGEITLELWVQILLDTQSVAQYIKVQMDCLRPVWMWDSAYSLSEQVERLREHGCMHLLLDYVSATRNRHIDTFERKLLEDVHYRGLKLSEYEHRWAAEQLRRVEEQQAHWKEVFGLVGRLATVLDGMKTYNHSALTKRLRKESNGAFQLQRSDLNRDSLVVEVRYNYWVGQSANLQTGFELVNYCLALADEIEKECPTFSGYLSACDRAKTRMACLVEPSLDTAHPTRRPLDDFDA
ncbi:hypothetical protein QO021_30145 (plasmid) [Pseudomonas amygdali pv. lachrymans]|uniref:hypothetical protein n=1 Tax=Pseudomonas amygdali TaxID=47877 RepID=UPI0006BA06CB|nr:hypothetical protein [Pseudomonas amygdali]KPC02054.1 Uncharacterized protein AC501_3340 [Pseudomonas amygdali pv. lachrymans]RMM39493.1 hypothetical protein ALQ79_200307 [Pseudomonas amygdali pv. lachrymans]WIO61350.1 hypothetical protein QO021_30145 [Pseudomonas amygdali pv. lachrymans]